MRKLSSILALSIFILFYSCIEEVDIKTAEEKKLLVIEGHISTLPGPHLFKLSKSAKYGSIFEGFSKKEENASLFIKDDLGTQVFLEEIFAGTYQTPRGFKAEVGRSYTLIINSKAGQYISTAEKVEPVPQIKKLEARFKRRPTTDPEIVNAGVEVYATFDDPAEEQNFVFWNTQGTFIMYTKPEDFVIRNPPAPPFPSPKSCCDRCFFEENKPDPQFRIYSDRNTNGNETNELAVFLPDDGGRFDEKYLVRIEQHSLSREAFQFYKLLNEQLEINGDIFDPPPASITSNIVNVTNPDQKVIGYFHATDVSKDSIYIESSLLEARPLDRYIPDDCRVIGGYVDPPSYWQ